MEQGYEDPKTVARGAGGKAATLPKVNKAFRNVLEYFEKNKVQMVVRLNKKLYSERRFTDLGMEHRESGLYLFLEIVDDS